MDIENQHINVFIVLKKNKTITIPIIYRAGEYGSYLYWVLNNFTNIGLHNSPGRPWGQFGNSHNQKNRNLGYPNSFVGWEEYTNSNANNQGFFLVHPGYANTRDMLPNAISTCTNEILSLTEKGIFLYTTNDLKLLMLNNCNEKMMMKNWMNKTFNISPTSNLNIREQLSYQLIDRVPATNISPNSLQIDVIDLLFNFKNTFNLILTEFNLIKTADSKTIMQNHNAMLSLQQHLHKDKDISKFLKNFKNRVDCKLPNYCTILDEAFIQRYLRDNLSLELRCDDIGDNFPLTTNKLWEYAYPQKDMQCEK